MANLAKKDFTQAMTTAEIADMLGVKKQAIQNITRKNRFVRYKNGNQNMINVGPVIDEIHDTKNFNSYVDKDKFNAVYIEYKNQKDEPLKTVDEIINEHIENGQQGSIAMAVSEQRTAVKKHLKKINAEQLVITDNMLIATTDECDRILGLKKNATVGLLRRSKADFRVENPVVRSSKNSLQTLVDLHAVSDFIINNNKIDSVSNLAEFMKFRQKMNW